MAKCWDPAWPEAPGDGLVLLGHAQIAFGQIVIEWHPLVGEKAQGLIAMRAQSLNEIERRGLRPDVWCREAVCFLG